MRPERCRGHQLVVEPEILEQGRHRGHAHEQRIGAGVDQVSAELLRGNLATELRPSLDESDLHPFTETAMDEVRRRNTAHPAADDHNLWLSLHRAPVLTKGLTSSVLISITADWLLAQRPWSRPRPR